MNLRAIWRAVAEPSLTRRLLLAQMGLLVALWLASIAYFVHDTAYVNQWYEPRQMRERADMILTVIDSLADRPEELRRSLTRIDEFQRDENRENDAEGVRVSLNAWLGDQLLYATPGEPGVVLVTRYDEIETSHQNGRRIRSYARKSADSAARVAIILPADGRSVFLTFWSSGIVLLPLLVSMPLLLLPALISVWMALRPFRELSAQVATKGTHDLEPLAFRARHRELVPLVSSVNELLLRIREGLMRERRFVADAAHELRTPIAAVGLNVEALQKRLDAAGAESAVTGSLLASLLSSSQRAARLVAQLLALMRSDSTREAAGQTLQPLGELAQETLAAAAPLAGLTDVELELCGDSPGPPVRGDREGLCSLLQNLIENAIKYSPPRGRVVVDIEHSGAGAVLNVSDEGPGIPEDYHERVFERFFRVPSQTQTGSGLGLAIVKAIADRLGARVSLATAPWGHGLQVTVRFPPAEPAQRCRATVRFPVR
jgi:two-component system sensor histidine kinase QseC